MATAVVVAVVVVLQGALAAVPVPNARQYEFMETEMSQFMHFGIPTFWDPPESYLHSDNPTYHDCHTTTIDHGPQTEGYYPCLNPKIFNPTNFSADNWMQHSAAMGMKEICITAHHEGGFALWPSNFTNYSVAASAWRGGKGDVLREFADAANRWGIRICYYLNVQEDGYMVQVAKYDAEEFIRRQVGMVKEVLTEYGPVHRFWFDGTQMTPKGTNMKELWGKVYDTIRTVSPDTLISAYRGDVCAAHNGHTMYTNNGPPPNSTDISNCESPVPNGQYFHPTEMHGVTVQQGPDGNTDSLPTYWFWHPWACAFNKPGCPWIGHGNASRLFDSYLFTVGRGAVMNMNIPPERTGQMNASVAQVMIQVGQAINATFKHPVASAGPAEGKCTVGAVHLDVPAKSQIDYVMTMEDMLHGQRIANYSVEYQARGSQDWHYLVPPVTKEPPLGDRPDGHDPRDSYVGRKRIDFPVVNSTGAHAVDIAAVRFNCHQAFEEPIYVRQFSVHKKTVPWE